MKIEIFFEILRKKENNGIEKRIGI